MDQVLLINRMMKIHYIMQWHTNGDEQQKRDLGFDGPGTVDQSYDEDPLHNAARKYDTSPPSFHS